MPPAPWASVKIIPGNRDLSFTRRQASPTCEAQIVLWPDIRRRVTLGFRRGEFPQLHAPWGALPTGAPPTANYSSRISAPPAALEFVKTISGARCSGLGGQPRTCAGPGGEEPSSLSVRGPGPRPGWVGRRKAEAGGGMRVTADLPAFFYRCEPQILRPGLTGAHSR